jgi:hypothetical protein
LLRDICAPENPAKIGQKSVYFHECESFKASAPVTYSFNPSKQTDFPVPNPRQLSLFASLPLGVLALKPRRKLTKTGRFRRKLAQGYCTSSVAQISKSAVSQASSLHTYPNRLVGAKMNKTSAKMNTCGGGGCSFSPAPVPRLAAPYRRRPASERIAVSNRTASCMSEKPVQNEYILSTKGVGGCTILRDGCSTPESKLLSDHLPENRQNRRTRRFPPIPTTLYQVLTQNQNRRTPIFAALTFSLFLLLTCGLSIALTRPPALLP